MSPGPSFVFVARTAVAESRRNALAASLGMGLGAVAFAILVLLGMQAFLLRVPWLYAALKVAGGVYLAWQAVRLWRGAGNPLTLEVGDPADGSAANHAWRAGWRGLFTQLSNPKTAVVYGSIFAALLPPDLPHPAVIALPFVVFAIEAGWYAIVAVALSAAAPRRAYLRCKTTIDRVAGGVLGWLGWRLIWSAREAN